MTYEEILSDANNLYRAYKASVKGSKWKETTQKFMMNFLRYIFSIQEDLLNRTLENGPTEEFSLSERGRVRPITSIRIRDRIVRHVLCDDVLLPEVKKHIIYDNGASIKGRGISHQRERFEVHLRRYYKLHGNEELLDLLEHIKQIADELGIHINEKKTRIVKMSSTYKFLQVKYTLTKDGKIIKRINPERITTMRRKLKKLAAKVDNGEVLYENVENMFRGWMGSFYKLLSRQQRKNLMTLYGDLFNKTLSVVDKKLVIFDKEE